MKTDLKFIKYFFFICLLALFDLPSKSYAHQSHSSSRTFDQWLELSEDIPELTTIYQSSAVFILDDLLKHRIFRVGAIQVVQLKTDILNSVQWRTISGKTIQAGPFGSRSSAMYSSARKMVIVSYEEWKKTNPPIRPMLALHEALGALGYRDELYQITMGLAMMSVVHSLDQLSNQSLKYRSFYSSNQWPSFFADANVLKRQTVFGPVPRQFADGGITGVGSGGDEVMIQIKFSLLFLAPEIYSAFPDKFNLESLVINILEMQIEPATQSGEGLSAVQLTAMTEISVVSGHFKIIVPKNSELNNLQNQNTKLYYVLLLDKLLKKVGVVK